MKKFLLAFCLSAAMVMSAAVAQADIVTDWTYTTTGVLKDITWTSGSDGYAGPYGSALNGGYTEYRWGNNATTNSGLTVGSYSGSLTTEGTAVNGLLITHHNNALSASYKTLAGGTIFATIELTGDGGLASYKVTSSINFSFYETPNTGDYQNDIFYMTASEIMKGVGDFTYNGERYYVYLHSNIQALEGEYLRMAQEHGGYSSDTILYGWTTLEGETFSNGYQLSLRISQTPPSVPVPGAVWLMGTGIAGLVAMKRRGKKQ